MPAHLTLSRIQRPLQFQCQHSSRFAPSLPVHAHHATRARRRGRASPLPDHLRTRGARVRAQGGDSVGAIDEVQLPQDPQPEQERPQDGAPPPPPRAEAPPLKAEAALQPRASTGRLLVTLAVVTSSAIVNRVMYKMALVPLGDHIFFLSQLQTGAYLLVYFGVLALRYRSGAVTREMAAFPLRSMPGTFLAIGAVEALASLLGFVGAANLPGVVLPLLAQTILLWQVLLAATVLRKRLSASQVVGVMLVMAGVCMAAWPGGGGSPLTGINPFYASVFCFSMLFPALDTLLKERVFRHARAALSADLDLFVCNSFGSLSQCLFVFALLPAMAAARGLSMAALPQYLADGWQCFRGLSPPCGGDCSLSPALPLAYLAVNLLFNVSALELIRLAGNVVMSLTMSSIVPLTILAFAMPLPFLPPPPPLGPLFLLGSAVLFAGLMAFNAPLWLPAAGRRLRAQLAVR